MGVMLLALLLGSPATPESVAARDAAFGALVVSDIRAQHLESEDGEAAALLARFASAVLALETTFQLHLLAGDRASAVATPGGHLWISEGLLLLCPDADAAAAAILHVAAHARAADCERLLAASYGEDRIERMAAGRDADVRIGIATNLATSGRIARTSQVAEGRADDATLAALAALGRRPAAWPELLSELRKARATWRRLAFAHQLDEQRILELFTRASGIFPANTAPAGDEIFAALQSRLSSRP